MRTVLVDRSELFRDCLATFLATRGHEVLGSVGAVSEALARPDLAKAQVLLLDDCLMDERTADLLAQRARGQLPRVLLLTVPSVESPTTLLRGLASDTARVDRRSDLATLERALRGIGTRTLPRPRQPSVARPRLQVLTEREDQVVGGLVRGHSTATIADDLGVSVHTVHSHVQGILRKLEAKSRLEAVSTYLRLGSHAWGREGLSSRTSHV